MMMRELDRGELLDRLPEYVHGTLSVDERRAVDAALASDPEMVRELEMVRAARATFTGAAASVNVDRIVAAVRQAAPRHRVSFSRWRIAAAVGIIAVGGASLAIVQSLYRGTTEPVTIVGETASVADEALSVSFGYDLSDLSSDDLDQLVEDLKNSGGVPSTEPRSAVVTSGSEEIQ